MRADPRPVARHDGRGHGFAQCPERTGCLAAKHRDLLGYRRRAIECRLGALVPGSTPRQGLEQQLQTFIDWFSRHQADLDPLLRAGIAHFWFVTLHPFDDGNGRLTRTLTDLALAQDEAQAIRFYAMSMSILDDRAGYYRILENSQKATLDITAWLTWFLQTLLRSLQQAMKRIDSVFCKARFWQVHRNSALTPEQIKVLNQMLDGGEKGFEGGISAAQYQAVTKVSKATATRHLAELLEKGYLERMPGGGRSTRYRVSYPAR